MLRIVEVNSEARFEELRQQEDSNCDYLYICKHCNAIKLSDNGTIKNFTRIRVCETQKEYDEITEKEDILYIINIDETAFKLYFNTAELSGIESTSASEYTSEEISTAVNELWTNTATEE